MTGKYTEINVLAVKHGTWCASASVGNFREREGGVREGGGRERGEGEGGGERETNRQRQRRERRDRETEREG